MSDQFVPTQEQRSRCLELAKEGESMSFIAQCLGLPLKELKEAFAYELLVGEEFAQSNLLASSYKQGINGDAKYANIWLQNTSEQRELRNLNTKIARQKLRLATIEADTAQLRYEQLKKDPNTPIHMVDDLKAILNQYEERYGAL